MTEHDVPTVACATLWLDTSSQTTTRRSEHLDECATLAFERPPQPELQSDVPARPAPPAATAVLDRAQLIAAIDHHVTDELGREPPLARQLCARRTITRNVATHALALIVGAALSAAWLAVPHPQPAAALAEPPASQPAQAAPSAAKAPARQEPEPDAAAPSPIADASQSRAVDALARGDYVVARAQYEALARQHPNDAALSAVAALLAARASDRCAEGNGSCAR